MTKKDLNKLNKDLIALKKNTDSWLREFQRRTSNLENLEKTVNENSNNIDFNYELILELKNKLELSDKTLILIINLVNSLIDSTKSIKNNTLSIYKEIKYLKTPRKKIN